jgi:predicted component of type VI protein secretion system
MADAFEFELVFALPEGEHDAFALSDAIFEAGFEDARVGTGHAGLLGVELEAEGDDAESAILEAARELIKALPTGTVLREVRPDLVSLADVAERLEVKRQALQQRRMPRPVADGLYRIDEMIEALREAARPKAGQRRPRFNLDSAAKWFRAGPAARRLNAQLTMREIDPATIRRVPRPEREEAAPLDR